MIRIAAVLGLLLLAFGGYVAGVPVVSGLFPVSPIVIGVGLTVLALFSSLVRRPDTKAVTPLLAIGLAFIPGIILAPNGFDYSDEKVLQLIFMVPLTAFGAAICVQDRRTLKWILVGFFIFGVVVAVTSFFYADESLASSGRFAAEGSNTTAAGRAAAAGFIMAVVCIVYAKHRTLAVAAAVFFAVATVLSGARGPIMAAVIGLAVALLLSRARVSAIVTVGVGAATWAGYRLALAYELVPERLLSTEDNSAQARGLLADVTTEIAASNPYGTGWGSLMLEYTNYPRIAIENIRYPHNIFLETAAEGGLVALVVLLVVLFIALKRTSTASNDWIETGALALLIFFTVNAAVSGDLISNRGFWLMLGICLAAVSRKQLAGSTGAEAAPLFSETPQFQYRLQADK